MAREEVPRRDVRSLLRVGVPVGIGVGLLSGMFGIGGGAFLILGLLAMGFSQHAAHATSLAAITVIAASAAVPFAVAGSIGLVASLVLAAGAMIGAYAGAAIMHRIPERELRILFIALLVLVALRMFVHVPPHVGVEAPAIEGWALAGLGVLGVAVGVLSAVLGVGGGLVFVPALVFLFGFSQHAAEGTSLAVVVPTALVGALRHAKRGYTSWRAGAVLGLSGFVAGPLGALVALRLEAVWLQRLFAVLVVIMAWRLARSTFRKRG